MVIRFRIGSKIALGAVLALFVASLGAQTQEARLTPRTSTEHPILAIGSPAPAFALPGVDGKSHRLSEYKNSPFLMVMFICNHCPTSQLYEGRMKKLVADYRGKGVAFVAIQPNDTKAVRLSERGYTDVGDSLVDMKIRAENQKFTFPYLDDGDTQTVTQAYGAQATPHVFLFDKERKLRYQGRIDDSQRESRVKIQDARVALDALLAGRPVPVPSTPAFGCSTKWKSKIESQEAQRKALESEPVKLETVTAEDLKTLRSNPTDKVTVVTFWAPRCASCVSGLPALIETYRMFRRRDFNLVTVAASDPDDKTGVMKTLESLHASSRNLEFASKDTSDMQVAFDSRWETGAPFTMAIAPGGRVIYRQQGALDILALRRAVLANLENNTYVGHPAYWVSR
jgi:thiol-disulfide isomerase/thioredoxin